MSNTINGIPINNDDANITRLLLGNLFNKKSIEFSDLQKHTIKSNFPEYKRPWGNSNNTNNISAEKLKFELIVLTFSSGVELLEKYEELKNKTLLTPYGTYQGYFLLESNQGNNLFNTLFLCAFGDAFRKRFQAVYNSSSTINANVTINGTSKVFDETLKGSNSVLNYFYNFIIYNDQLKDAQFVLPDALKFNKMVELELGNYIFDETKFNWLYYITGADEFLANKITSLANWVDETLIIKQQHYIYDPPAAYAPILPITTISNGIDALSSFAKDISQQFDTYKSEFTNAKNKIESFNIAGSVGTKAINIIESVIETISELSATVSSFLLSIKDEIVYFLQILNAVLCGIINGLVSLLSMIIRLVAFLVDWVVGPLTNLDAQVDEPLSTIIESAKRNEAIEDILDLLATNWKAIGNGIIQLFNNFSFADIKKIIETAIEKTPATQIAYFVGNFIFEVISGVIITIFSGGATLLAKAESIGQKIVALIKLFAKETIETATFGIIGFTKSLKKFFEQFIQIAAKGGKHLYNWVVDILRKLFTGATVPTQNIPKQLEDVIVIGKSKKQRAYEARKAEKEKSRTDRLERKWGTLDNVNKNLDGIRLKKLELDEWKKLISKLGGKVENIEKAPKWIKNHFVNKNIGASFEANAIPPTIWIRSDITDLEIFHESMHFEDFLRRGKKNYNKGSIEYHIPVIWRKKIPKRDTLIAKYIKEKYVLEKILEEQEKWIKKTGKGRFSTNDIQFSKDYFKRFENRCIKNGIDISKLTIKK
jgi:hypothetical protein